jgi:hypothetical protein
MLALTSFCRLAKAFTCLAAAVASLSCSKDKGTEDIGGVLAVNGYWQIAGQHDTIVEGQAVLAGSLIENRKAQASDSITIMLLSGERLEVTCARNWDLCTKGLQLPRTYVNASPGTREVIEAVKLVLLNHEPEIAKSFSPTLSRGRSSAQDRESVVAFTPGTAVNVGSDLTELPANDSSIDEIELSRVEDNTVIGKSPVSWDERRGASINLRGPGCYIAQVLRDDDEVALNLYLLAAPAASYKRTRAQFEQARQICSKWDGPNAAASIHKFLRAYLLSLANR